MRDRLNGTYTLLAVDGPWCDTKGEELLAVGSDASSLKSRWIIESGDYRLLLFGADLLVLPKRKDDDCRIWSVKDDRCNTDDEERT